MTVLNFETKQLAKSSTKEQLVWTVCRFTKFQSELASFNSIPELLQFIGELPGTGTITIKATRNGFPVK